MHTYMPTPKWKCLSQFMIQDSGEKLCKATDDLNTLLHVAAKNGLKVYVY